MDSDNKLLIYRTFPHLPYVGSKTYRKVLYGGIVWVMCWITIMSVIITVVIWMGVNLTLICK